MAEMPPSIDVDYFKFKQLRKLKINFNDQSLPDDKVASLLAVSNRFGLVFIGTPASQLLCLRTSDLVEIDLKSSPAEKRTEAVEFAKRETELPGKPSFVSLSADSLTLIVCVEKLGFPVGCLYDVRAFAHPEGAIMPFKEVRLSITEGVTVRDCAWNPAIVELVAICLSDGSLAVIGVDGANVNLNTLPAATNARALSWSPKGKQVVVARDSAIVQYKPDLKEARSIPFNLQVLGMDDSSRPMPCGILWLSTSQFLAAFADADNPDASPKVFIVNAHKTGPPTFINYEDICYEVSKERQRRYLMLTLASWNITLLASSTALEIGVLGQSGGTAEHPEWTQWYMEDAWRAELPLNASKEETYPLGVALDMTSQTPIPWGDNQKLEPVPILLILSTSGVLCPYHVINLTPGAEKLTHPAEILSAAGERKGADVRGAPQVLKAVSVPLAASTPVPAAERSAFPRSNLIDSFAAATQPATPVQPKPAPAATGFAFAKPPVPAAAPAKPVVPAVTPPLSVPVPVQTPAPATPQPAPTAPVVAAAPTAQQQVVAPSAGPSVNESNLLAAVLQGEVTKFQKELLEFKAKAAAMRGASIIGSEDDKQRLLKRTVDLQSFGKDLTDTTKTQSTEVQSLRSETVEVTALLDEARLRHARRKNPRFHQLLKMRPLDPVSRRRLANIQQLQAYLDTQTQESFQKLEQMTRDAQRPTSSLRSDRRLEIPVTQVIYEAVTTNEKTISRLCDKLERIKAKAKEQHMRTVGAAWDALRLPRTTEGGQWDSELAALADSLLTTQISKAAVNGAEASDASPVKSMIPQVSPEKQALLRDALANRPVSRIRSVRPETPGESRLLSNLNSMIQAAASPKAAAAEAIPEKPKPPAPAAVSPAKPAPAAKVEDITPPSTPINLEQKAKTIGAQTLMSSFALTPQQRTPPTPAPAPAPTVAPLSGLSGLSGFSLSADKPSAKPVPAAAPSFLSGFSLPAGTSAARSTAAAAPSGLSAFSVSTSAPPVKPAAPAAAPTFSGFTLSTGTPSFGSTPTPAPTAPVNAEPAAATAAPTIKPFSTAPSASIPAAPSGPVKSLFAAFSAVAAPPPPTAPSATSAAPPPYTASSAASAAPPPYTAPSAASAAPAVAVTSAACQPVTTAPSLAAFKPTVTTSAAAPSALPSGITVTPISSAATAATSTPAPFSFSMPKTPSAPALTSVAAPGASASAAPFSFNLAKTTPGTPSTTSAPTTASTFSFSVKNVPATTGAAPFSFSLGGTPSAPSAGPSSSAAIKPVQLFGQTPTSATSAAPAAMTAEAKAATPVTTSAPAAPLGGLLFGVKTTAATSASVAVTPSASSTTAFGQAATSTTSVFGQPATAVTTSTTSAPSAPLFGQATASTASATVLFGRPTATTSTASFGQPATTTTAATLFAQAAATTTTSSLFGQAPATSSALLFGQPAASTAAPLFGQAATTTTAAPTLPLFGQATTSAPSAPLFGAPVATAAPSGGLFGKPAAPVATSAPSAPLFGQPAATNAPSAPLFGAPVATAAPSAPLFGQSAFGQAPTTTASSFGFGSAAGSTGSSSAFGGKPAFGSSVFGQVAAGATAPLFGAATTTAPAAGTASPSATGGFGSSGMFGGMGLGGTPTASNANRNVFGGGTAFGASAPSGLFGSPAPSSGFGNAAAGASSPTPSAFGSFGQSPAQPAFGGAPTFGGSPLFGGKPTFGSGTPTGLGSPQAPPNSSAGGFGGFAAASNLPSFGVLAGSPSGQPAFGGAAFPQSTQPSFGSGSSFSSWR